MHRQRSTEVGGGLRARSVAAVNNPEIREALASTATRFRAARNRAADQYEGFEALRDHGRAIRAHTIANLDKYLSLLAERVRARGGYVHFAPTAEEALEVVLDVARGHGAKRVTKSKSMISEEIELNAALEREGVRAVETDMGEYIIQLARERPFHIIAPALHKTRRQVAELFRQAGGGDGLPSEPGIEELNAFARRQLRREFLSSDIGVTGCNFAVAEAGAVVIVTNEGNGRMQMSVPPVLITLMGMERVVPRWEDLGVMLELLTRSATGQKITSYVSVTAGPRREGEGDGPQEFHLVIVDNGRSRILGSEFQEALHCIRCGACLNVCPVYQQIGGHAYASVYSGPVGAVVTPLMWGIEEWGELANASSLCGACWEACPVRIPLHKYLIGIRQQKAEQEARRGGKGMETRVWQAWRWFMTNPARYRQAARTGSFLSRLLAENGRFRADWAGRLPVLREWLSGREMPAPAARSFRERWKQLQEELDDE